MSKEVEPGATGRSGKRGNEVFWTHPTKPGIIIARLSAPRSRNLTRLANRTPSHSGASAISASAWSRQSGWDSRKTQ